MSHQDWETVVFSKDSKPSKPTSKKIVEKYKTNNQSRLDKNDHDILKHKTTNNIGKLIQKQRLAMKLNQKDLAAKLNVKPSIIMEYESGKAIINDNKILSRIERILKIKLQGKNIGSEM